FREHLHLLFARTPCWCAIPSSHPRGSRVNQPDVSAIFTAEAAQTSRKAPSIVRFDGFTAPVARWCLGPGTEALRPNRRRRSGVPARPRRCLRCSAGREKAPRFVSGGQVKGGARTRGPRARFVAPPIGPVHAGPANTSVLVPKDQTEAARQRGQSHDAPAISAA